MLPVALQVPVRGSYSSAEAKALVVESSFESAPPATRTRPSGRSVAVCSFRATLMFAVARQLPRDVGDAGKEAAGFRAVDCGGADGWPAADGDALGGSVLVAAEHAPATMASAMAKAGSVFTGEDLTVGQQHGAGLVL
jgi:hypothetical protein